MKKKTIGKSWETVSWGLILSTLFIHGCVPSVQPVLPPPEPSQETRPPKIEPKSSPESLKLPQNLPAPPEPIIIERSLPQPPVIEQTKQQPNVEEVKIEGIKKAETKAAETKTEAKTVGARVVETKTPKPPAPPPSGTTEKAIPKDPVSLDPTVPKDARTIQTRLAKLGFYEGPIDGIWGKRSRAALVAFKEINSLGSSDQWDEETQRILFYEPSRGGKPVSASSQTPIASGVILLDPSVAKDAVTLQKRLAELGLYDGPIDGIWGKGSRAGLKVFKEEQSLKNPDQWDKETQMLLFRGTNQ
jgi:peptidoglycan hydrolase-like protein with peptidoglycan-binding domain